MGAAAYREAYFNQQADRIEETLATMSLPMRVSGGELREDRVRYHLSPAVGVSQDEIVAASERLAEAIGEPGLRVGRMAGELTIEVRFNLEFALRLLPFWSMVGAGRAFSALVGMSRSGMPVTIDFTRRATQHLLLIALPGSGKSEFLRSVMLALALDTPAAQASFFGVDVSGRELAIVEALPHARLELARDPQSARTLLRHLTNLAWDSSPSARRMAQRFLFIDGIAGSMWEDLQGLWRAPHDRLHIIASARWPLPRARSRLCRQHGILIARCPTRDEIEATGEVGLIFEVGAQRTLVEPARLTARDLDSAVRMVQSMA